MPPLPFKFLRSLQCRKSSPFVFFKKLFAEEMKLLRKIKKIPTNILISRTDSVGDMVLALPVAAILKKKFPDVKIGVMGRSYTKPVVNACKYVDAFIDLADFMNDAVNINQQKVECIIHLLDDVAEAKRAKKLNIPLRIGIANRWFHWVNCNILVPLSRSRSSLHEAQLNLKMLKPFGITGTVSLQEIGHLYGLENIQPLPENFYSLIDKTKLNIILHPKSRGNGREWGLDNFISLIKSLDQNRYKIFISGVESEKQDVKIIMDKTKGLATDIAGLMNLAEFISFIDHCDAVVASSTGPLHIAAALGKNALGIYAPIHPKHAARWGPVGPKAQSFFIDKKCSDCKANKEMCHCVKEVNPQWIRLALDQLPLQNENEVVDSVLQKQ